MTDPVRLTLAETEQLDRSFRGTSLRSALAQELRDRHEALGEGEGVVVSVASISKSGYRRWDPAWIPFNLLGIVTLGLVPIMDSTQHAFDAELVVYRDGARGACRLAASGSVYDYYLKTCPMFIPHACYVWWEEEGAYYAGVAHRVVEVVEASAGECFGAEGQAGEAPGTAKKRSARPSAMRSPDEAPSPSPPTTDAHPR